MTQGLDDAVCLRDFIPSLAMSLLGVPSRPCPPIFFPPTSSTPLTGIRSPLCATPPWCGNSGHLVSPTRHGGRIDQVHKNHVLMVEKKDANPKSKIDDFVNHVFQEHNQEADHLTKMEAEEQKIVVGRCSNSF